MPRYIDADKLIEMCKRQIEREWNTIAAPGTWADAFQDFSDLVEQTPTEDVAPRSEVAKEIFEEINVTWSESYGVGEFFEDISELKKKYTEGEK
jgi:hypothetical protein